MVDLQGQNSSLSTHVSAVSFVSGCAFLIRREVVQAVGGFDATYFMYEEDVELSLRLTRQGILMHYLPTAVVYHRVQGTYRRGDEQFVALYDPTNPRLSFYVYFLARNRLLTMRRYASGRRLLQFIVGFCLLWSKKVLQFIRHRRWDAIMALGRGLRDGLETRNGLRETLRADKTLFELVHQRPNKFKYIYHPDFRVVTLFRVSQFCFRRRVLRPLAYLLTMLNDFLHGVWIGPRVQAQPGLFLGHPRGLIINPTTKIGRNCAIMQQVTIGGPNVEIGDNVEINAGAKIISNIRGKRRLKIGNCVTIAAGAVVVKDVPDNSVVAGVPARVLRRLEPHENWVDFRREHPVE